MACNMAIGEWPEWTANLGSIKLTNNPPRLVELKSLYRKMPYFPINGYIKLSKSWYIFFNLILIFLDKWYEPQLKSVSIVLTLQSYGVLYFH